MEADRFLTFHFHCCEYMSAPRSGTINKKRLSCTFSRRFRSVSVLAPNDYQAMKTRRSHRVCEENGVRKTLLYRFFERMVLTLFRLAIRQRPIHFPPSFALLTVASFIHPKFP